MSETLPTKLSSGAEVLKFLGVGTGYTVYLKRTLGDYNMELKKSVTLSAGHEGIVDEIYLSHDGHWKVRVKILNPLAQPYLIWSLEDFKKSWTKYRKEVHVTAPVMLDRYQRLERDVLGELIEG